jgi:hypothetical protein
MAHLESSKEGKDAAGSEVMPTSQSLWIWSGEPRLVASKMAWEAGVADGTVLARVWGWAGTAAEGAGCGAWASIGVAPQTANHTAARILYRKTPPDPVFFTLQPRRWKLKENCKGLILKQGHGRLRAENLERRAPVAEIPLPIVAKRADTCV